MYQQQAGNPNDAGNAQGANDDNVVDAEFEEKK